MKVRSPRRTCPPMMMSYLGAVKVAIVVAVLLTQQAVRLLEKKNEACFACFLNIMLYFLCEVCLNRRSVLSDCSGVTRWLLVRDEMGMMS